jgi:hypothetical protein
VLVDCHTEDEQHGAFLVMLDDHVACPFKARIVGEDLRPGRDQAVNDFRHMS